MDKYGLTYITINRDHLLHNARYFKNKSGKKLIAVIKSNAYGHGMLEVAQILNDEADCYAVDSLDYALSLREHGFTKPILILNPIDLNYLDLVLENDLMITVSSLSDLQNIVPDTNKLKLHIKVDTGMNRFGIKCKQELDEMIQYIKTKNWQLVGIYTHYHSPNNEVYSKHQQKRFLEMLQNIEHDFTYVHLCSTSAVLNDLDLPETTHVRVGLGLYGICDSPEVKPVLSLYSKIVLKKNVSAEETVGYGANYQAKEDMWIGVLPCGYADGIIRHNTNRKVYIDGHYTEIIGNVCMNALMIKLPHPDVKGDVELIGEHVSTLEIARHLNTISYEVTTILPSHLKRIII